MLMKIYDALLDLYGHQGWWPVTPTCTTEKRPMYGVATRTEKQKFEVILGAILTQNTSWKNVEKAITNMWEHDLVDRKHLEKMSAEEIAPFIRSAGYFNQKAKKIKAFLAYNGLMTREGLLSIWGLGPETVDSILLYAYKEPQFVVDAYTRRMFSEYGLIAHDASYDDIKEFFEENIKTELQRAAASGRSSELQKELVQIYNEYHALIVAHGKEFYSKRPYGRNDPIKKVL
ncbi:MAG: endonuclease III domain-containing protein [Nanoarchaeota archaeon]